MPRRRSRPRSSRGLDWKAFNSDLKQRGLVLAGGQGKLTGKIFRLGHLGSVTIDEILGAIATLEIVSIESRPAGRARQRGRGRPARRLRSHGHRRGAVVGTTA